MRIAGYLALPLFALAAFWYFSRAEPIPVVLRAVERGLVEATVANTRAGTVLACRRSRLAPAAGGQVAALAVREGDRVRQGQVLMSIWNEDLKAELDLARREAAQSEAKALEACLTAQVTAREAARLSRLEQKNLVSEERVDRATTDARARQAGCDAAEAALEVSRAQIKVAQTAIEKTILRAPFAGIVAEVTPELGEFVTPSPVGIPTPPAVDLIEDRCLYVTAPIDEVDAPAIRVGMPACVSLDAFPERFCTTQVRRIAPYVLDREKQARTVEVEVAFTEAADTKALLPGYSADVEIVLSRRNRTLRLPTEAVLEGDQVLVFRPADGLLEARTITPGLANWRYTEVLAGVTEGEQVVVSVDSEGVKAGAHAVPKADSEPRATAP
nr:efflux RND transporter periplasmic adaptor subunit [Gammaproteobacteria bacterium]